MLPGCLLEPLNQPFVNQRLRRYTTSTGLLLNPLVGIRFESHSPPTLDSDLEFTLMRFIPEVSETVFVLELTCAWSPAAGLAPCRSFAEQALPGHNSSSVVPIHRASSGYFASDNGKHKLWLESGSVAVPPMRQLYWSSTFFISRACGFCSPVILYR